MRWCPGPPLRLIHRCEDGDALLGPRELLGKRSLAVPVGDHAVGHAALQPVHRDLQEVAGTGILHVDRPGVHMRTVLGRAARMIACRQRDGVAEHLLLLHSVPGEVGARIPPLVLQNPLMGQGVDHDLLPRSDAQHRVIGGAGQTAPQDVFISGGEVGGTFGDMVAGLEDSGHRPQCYSPVLRRSVGKLRGPMCGASDLPAGPGWSGSRHDRWVRRSCAPHARRAAARRSRGTAPGSRDGRCPPRPGTAPR